MSVVSTGFCFSCAFLCSAFLSRWRILSGFLMSQYLAPVDVILGACPDDVASYSPKTW